MTVRSFAQTSEEDRLVHHLVARTTQLTPLKTVATRVIQMAQDERTQTMDLAAVISADQALTAQILRLSNSPYYGYARRINNVREAVILLGMRTVRSVAVSSAIIDAFKLPDSVGDFSTDLFWGHCVTTGLVAEQLARQSKACRPEDAFTAGVLHDVGKLAIILSDPAAFVEICDIVRDERVRSHDAERAVLGVTHDQVGAALADAWRFPDTLVAAIRDHHPHGPVSSLASLSDVVAVANFVCHREGYACGYDWTKNPERREAIALPPEVEFALARVPGGFHGLAGKARAFLMNVTSRTPRWYSSVEDPESEEVDPSRAVA